MLLNLWNFCSGLTNLIHRLSICEDTTVRYHDNDNWPAHPPVGLWSDYGLVNDFMNEWGIRKKELKSGQITNNEYFEWKSNWPMTCDDCGKHEPMKQWRTANTELSET